jgi:hypothetical protein
VSLQSNILQPQTRDQLAIENLFCRSRLGKDNLMFSYYLGAKRRTFGKCRNFLPHASGAVKQEGNETDRQIARAREAEC